MARARTQRGGICARPQALKPLFCAAARLARRAGAVLQAALEDMQKSLAAVSVALSV
jgi:hypothetical protein